MSLKLIIFYGSVREGRMCTRVGTFVKKHFEESNHSVTIFDPLEMEFPMMKKPLHFYQANEVPPDWLVQRNALIEEADGFVVISTEYNRSIPPALANMMNHFSPTSYICKPCSIVTYSMGPAGGCVAAMQLRCFLGELNMITPGFMYIIGDVHIAFTEDGKPTERNSTAVSQAKRLVSEWEWYATALKAQVKQVGKLHWLNKASLIKS